MALETLRVTCAREATICSSELRPGTTSLIQRYIVRNGATTAISGRKTLLHSQCRLQSRRSYRQSFQHTHWLSDGGWDSFVLVWFGYFFVGPVLSISGDCLS